MSKLADDERAIEKLMTTYASAVDTQNWKQYVSVFHPDAEIDYTAAGGIQGDLKTVAAWMASVFRFFSITQHMVSNFEIDVDGDLAVMRAMFHNPCCIRFVPFPQPFFSVGERS
jgi:3-phenylpropionate/cinnamic acid dioxygenase small subunit